MLATRMIRQSLLECSFLIPVRRDSSLSDGELHEPEAWQWLNDELFERFGGRTVAPGLFSGVYVDPDTDQRVEDKSRKFIVALGQDKIESLRVLLVEACLRFRQKLI